MGGDEIKTHSLSRVFFGRLKRDTGIQPLQGLLVYFQLARLGTVEIRRQKTFTRMKTRDVPSQDQSLLCSDSISIAGYFLDLFKDAVDI